MSVFGDSSTPAPLRKLLKTNTVLLATNLHSILRVLGRECRDCFPVACCDFDLGGDFIHQFD
jgi:hypothetical protein